MTSPARLAANRANALRSTGARTPAGKATSALNAVTTGLYSRQVVLAALGESTETLDAFRAAVAEDLDVDGPVEHELADQVALLLWRRRRVAAAEEASVLKGITDLPPEPDTVTGKGVDWTRSLPPHASPAVRLAHVRALLHVNRIGLDSDRILAARFAGPETEPLHDWHARQVRNLFGPDLGWTLCNQPDPWDVLVRGMGKDPAKCDWTVGLVLSLIAAAAFVAERDPVALLETTMARISGQPAKVEAVIAEPEREERELVAELRIERERVVTAALASDERLVKTVAKLEGHLGREVQRTLEVLRAVQSDRRGGHPGAAAVGFVFAQGVSEEDETPIPLPRTVG